jgi:glycosyltransferase involved in cell wall biosynthesis
MLPVGAAVGTVLIVSNTAWSIFNFRRALIAALREKDFHVLAAAPSDEYAAEVGKLGCDFRPLPMDNAGTNPFRDALLLLRLRKLIRTHRVSMVLTFTVKPNVYGAMAAWSLGVPIICNVTGIGTAFLRRDWLSRLVSALYRFALHRACHSFFQNRDHQKDFVDRGIAPRTRISLLPGSGVDTQRFSPKSDSRDRPPFRFLLLGRVLRDKGVVEYVEAARRVRASIPNTEFLLMGFMDVANRSAIPKTDIEDWVASGIITFIPARSDVRDVIAASDCVVLPSYTEGMPRSLLEGAAMAKPLIATDVPGCREVVEHGVNGYLVRPRDALALSQAMQSMLELSPDMRTKMGLAGREKVVREYDERVVIQRYLEQITKCSGALSSLASK